MKTIKKSIITVKFKGSDEIAYLIIKREYGHVTFLWTYEIGNVTFFEIDESFQMIKYIEDFKNHLKGNDNIIIEKIKMTRVNLQIG